MLAALQQLMSAASQHSMVGECCTVNAHSRQPHLWQTWLLMIICHYLLDIPDGHTQLDIVCHYKLPVVGTAAGDAAGKEVWCMRQQVGCHEGAVGVATHSYLACVCNPTPLQLLTNKGH